MAGSIAATGYTQSDYPKAFDFFFADMITPDMRMYSVCRAKTDKLLAAMIKQ